VDYLLVRDEPFHGSLDMVTFLKRVWDLSQMPSTDSRFSNAEGDIWQHIVNNDDWSLPYLLNDYLDLRHCEDNTFIKFIEACVHPLLRLGLDTLGETISTFNALLRPDGLSLVEATQISGRAVYRVRGIDGQANPHEPAYEIVLSFAAEQRRYVREVAEHLKAKEVAVFFDEYEEATMWGKHLTEHLATVYGGTARYCVMFISTDYAEKVWTTHERRVAFAKAVSEKKEYVLPARFDDTVIPGLSPDVHYISLEHKTPTELADLILRKLGRLRER
jgi:hypothetical protein